MFCRKCGEFLSFNINDESLKCHCNCFEIEDHEGNYYIIYAHSTQEAALKFAEQSNKENDYYLMNESVEIIVDGEKFRISAEPSVCYSAKEIWL